MLGQFATNDAVMNVPRSFECLITLKMIFFDEDMYLRHCFKDS
jgi:hypothetical protein